MEYERILKDGAHLFIGKIGTIIISLLDLILLSRILTTEDMGKYSLFLMILNLVLVVGFNWADTSIIRHGREEFVNLGKVNKSFWARIYLFVPIMSFFIILFITFSKKITSYIGIDHRLIIILVTMFILNAILNLITFLYQSTNQMKKSAYVLFSQKLLYLISLGLVFFNLIAGNITVILILINLSFLISIIINLMIFDTKLILPYKFDKKYLKKIWSYSWPQLMGFPGLYVINYIDLFVIKKYMTLHDVGTYSLAYTGFTNICALIMIIYTIFFPLMVEYRTKKKFGLIKKYTKKIPVMTVVWVVPVIIGVLISKHIIPTLFSVKYLESINPFNILLVASVFYFIYVCILPMINAFDLIIYSQIIILGKAAINIIADFILVPKLGIIGAAYATTFSYAITLIPLILLLYFNRKRIIGAGDS